MAPFYISPMSPGKASNLYWQELIPFSLYDEPFLPAEFVLIPPSESLWGI